MSKTLAFNRMPRILKALPEEEVQLPQPPALSPPPKPNWFLLSLPLVLMLVTVGVRIAQSAAQSSNSSALWMTLSFTLMSVGSGVTSLVNTISQRKAYQQKKEEQEREYAQVLADKRKLLEDFRYQQSWILREKDPELQILLDRAINHEPHLWERRLEDPDFLHMRVGTGDAPSSVAVQAPHPPMPDPRLAEAHQIETEYSRVPGVPRTVDLTGGPLGIAGPLEKRLEIARAIICNLAAHHSPDEMYLLALFAPERTEQWQWLKWLPHTYLLDPDVYVRYLANDEVSAKNMLDDLLEMLHQRQNLVADRQTDRDRIAWPWIVLLVDEYSMAQNNPAVNLLLTEGPRLGATAIFMVDEPRQVPKGCHTVAELLGTEELECSTAGVGGETFRAWPDRANVDLCETLARCLAPLQVQTYRSDSDMPSVVRLFKLFDLASIDQFAPTQHWRKASEKIAAKEYLKVKIGQRRGGQPMILDLSHTGHGPHGLVAGTTGAGKSELLQTMLLSLAMTHHPHQVGFVLVDFKGGGTFNPLKELPHTLGVVTDLGGNMTTRALTALNSEMDSRKRRFSEADVNDILAYQQKHEEQDPRAAKPLPRLVVVIDEFAELVSDYPDFIDGLVGIARVGRSLGVHLILATQSPAGVVKQQMWANARFRICLRVESRQESSDMLHRGDAANLPRIPGRGYFQVGNNEIFELFQSAYVGAAYRDQTDPQYTSDQQERYTITEILLTGRQHDPLFDSQPPEEQSTAPKGPTDLEVIVQKLAESAAQLDIEKLPSPWPDPLPQPEDLSVLAVIEQLEYAAWDGTLWTYGKVCPQCSQPLQPQQQFCPECGQKAAQMTIPWAGYKPNLPGRPWLEAVLGLIDNPIQQVQEPFRLSLDEQDGHLIVIGAQGAGKEMLLRTLISSLVRTHTPQELNIYAIEFGGQALRVFEQLPHVGNILAPLDEERINRLLLYLLDELAERQTICTERGFDNLTTLREQQPEKARPAILLIVTGFAEFRNAFTDEVQQLTRLLREGGPYGIHIVLAGDRAGDMPSSVSSMVSRRIVLRLADVDEYSLVLGTRLRVSNEQQFPSGRGWYGRPPLEFQTALPGQESDETAQVAELQRLVADMGKEWPQESVHRIDVLKEYVPFDQIIGPDTQSQGFSQLSVPIGLDRVRLHPACLDVLEDGPDFIVTGTPKGGKTSFLITWTLALAHYNSPQQVQFVLVAGRRNSLAPLEKLPHTLEYCRTPQDFVKREVIERLSDEIDRRDVILGDAGAENQVLAHIVVILDDYDDFSNQVGSDAKLKEGLSKLAKRGQYVHIHTVVTGPLPDMGVDFGDQLIKLLKNGKSGIALRILDTNSVQSLLGLRVRDADIKDMPPGRGFVVRNSVESLIQVAYSGKSAALGIRVDKINDYWRQQGAALASWPDIPTS